MFEGLWSGENVSKVGLAARTKRVTQPSLRSCCMLVLVAFSWSYFDIWQTPWYIADCNIVRKYITKKSRALRGVQSRETVPKMEERKTELCSMPPSHQSTMLLLYAWTLYFKGERCIERNIGYNVEPTVVQYSPQSYLYVGLLFQIQSIFEGRRQNCYS